MAKANRKEVLELATFLWEKVGRPAGKRSSPYSVNGYKSDFVYAAVWIQAEYCAIARHVLANYQPVEKTKPGHVPHVPFDFDRALALSGEAEGGFEALADLRKMLLKRRG